jgi:hypothetical protein
MTEIVYNTDLAIYYPQDAKRYENKQWQGHGQVYQPWLHVRDVPSRGTSHRVMSWTVGRTHQLLSQLEYHYFLLLDWSPLVIDIREQYPLLPLEKTIAIAQELGVAHPKDPKSGKYSVMTTDFLVTVTRDSQTVEEARTLKYAQDLEKARVLEKFWIEAHYWDAQKVDWGIVTEKQIPEIIVNNIVKVHKFRHLNDLYRRLPGLKPRDLNDIAELLTNRVMQSDDRIRDIARDCDDHLGYDSGTSLTLAYHLIATKQWSIEMNVPLEPGNKLTLLSAELRKFE